jgi:hypothetical protein
MEGALTPVAPADTEAGTQRVPGIDSPGVEALLVAIALGASGQQASPMKASDTAIAQAPTVQVAER